MRRLDEPGDAVERGGRLALRIAAEQVDGALVGTDETEQDPHRGRLARAVRPEEAVDVAGLDVQVDVVDGDDMPVPFDQTPDRDRRGAHRHTSAS